MQDDKTRAKRFNQDKINLSLLPAIACQEEAKVWMMGEQKYGRDNWKKLWGDDTVNTVMDSLLRHAFAIISGEVNDPESGLDHAAHIRCNAAMILEYREKCKVSKAEADNVVSAGTRVIETSADGALERVAVTRRFMDGFNTEYVWRAKDNGRPILPEEDNNSGGGSNQLDADVLPTGQQREKIGD